MTTLPDRSATALLVVDVQTAVVDGAHDRDGVVGRIATLVDRARAAGTPVVWVQHHDDNIVRGSGGWEIVPELSPAPAEPLVEKSYSDAFESTTLSEVLADLGVGRLLVAGAQTDQCIRGTLHGAFVRGYDTVLISDAHTTEDGTAWGAPPPESVIAHTNLYWKYESAPGREAGTVASAEVEF